jgi:hypothetical protein
VTTPCLHSRRFNSLSSFFIGARVFYLHHEVIPLTGHFSKLFIAMATIQGVSAKPNRINPST